MYTRCHLLLIFSLCLSAQSPAGVTRSLAVTLSGKDAGHIRNEYSSPATAWILQCETPQGGSRYYWNDQELSFETKPIAPGQVRITPSSSASAEERSAMVIPWASPLAAN